jgi:hypothetical protein
MITQDCVAGVGLILDFLGAALLTRELFISKAEAEKRTATMFNGNADAAHALLRQSRVAVVGGTLLAIGFALQLVGVIAF